MFKLKVLFIVCLSLLSFSVSALDISGSAKFREKLINVLNEFQSCNHQFSDFLYKGSSKVTLDNLKEEIPDCQLATTDNTYFGYIDLVNILKSVIEQNTPLSERIQCYGEWQKNWRKAVDKMLLGGTWHIVGPLKIEPPTQKYNKKTLELYARARIDRELTLIAEKGGSESTGSSACYSTWRQISFGRAENIAFIDNNRFFEKHRELGLSNETIPSLWLIVQHADLYAEFRNKGLNFFKGHEKEYKIDSEYVKAIERRMSMNPEYYLK